MFKRKRPGAPHHEDPDLVSRILVNNIFKDFSRKIRDIGPLRKAPLLIFGICTKKWYKKYLYIPFKYFYGTINGTKNTQFYGTKKGLKKIFFGTRIGIGIKNNKRGDFVE